MESTVKSFCFVTTFFNPHIGGVERFVGQFSKHLSRLGHKVVIVALNTANLDFKEEIDSITIYRIPFLNFLGSRFPVPKPNAHFFSLLKEIKSIQFDYFIINMRIYINSLLWAWLGKRQKSNVLLIEHVSGHLETGNYILNKFSIAFDYFITLLIKRFVDKFYGVSEKCSEWLTHFNIDASGVIYNGISVEHELSSQQSVRERYCLSDHSIIVTYAGRLIKEKGIILLIRVFQKLLQKYPDAQLFIAGSGALVGQVLEIAMNYKENIHFLGVLSHESVMNLLKETDIAVNPSWYPEGLPTFILEAGLSGCSVISTDKGGIKEVIVDENHGIIISPKSETELEAALEKLILDIDYRKKISVNISNRVKENFAWDKITNNFINELEKNW